MAHPSINTYHNQTQITMKQFFFFHKHIRTLLLMCSVAICSVNLSAQTTGKAISITVKNATLEDFVKAVEAVSGFSFVYGEKVKLTKTITLDLKNKSLDDILKQAFADQPVSYQITERHILLKRSEAKTPERKYTISGYVTDQQSSETLIGANIVDLRTYAGTTTNPYGYYTLTVPAGETDINFSYLGYAPFKQHLRLNRDTLINIRLVSENMLDEVVITSDRVDAGIMATHPGSMEIPITQIKNTPTVLGEADVMKTIQLMPGVQAGVEGSAGLHVRGGSPDQNLILLDGVPVYNVDHLLGFFSVFTPEAMKKVSLFKSSFPARFGGRLSSVIDVRTNDGDMKNYHGAISLGLLTTKLNFEGPIVKDRTAFNISVRRTYLDLVTRPFMRDDFRMGYYFYDINAKVNHKFSDQHRLYLSFYQGQDYYNYKNWDEESFDEFGYRSYTENKISGRWGNTIGSIRWNYIINNKLFSNTTVAFNEYKFHMHSHSFMEFGPNETGYNTNYNSGIRDISYQLDFDYNPVPNHHIKFGGSYLYHGFRPEVMTSKVKKVEDEAVKQDTLYKGISNSKIYAHEFSAYVEDNFDVNSRLRTNIGLHLSAFHVQSKTYFSLQPRLAARYQVTDDVSLKASFSKMNQYINLLTSAPISMPSDLWVPVTKNIKPMRSFQYSLGGYYTGIKGWEFSVEGYYKDMYNVLEYKDATRILGSSSTWEEKVEMGRGRSFGIEFMAQRTIGKTTGWIAYTLAKSDRKFKKGGINNGDRFPFKYDRRHDLGVMINHKFSNRIDAGASWSFATGGTTTIPQEVTSVIRPPASMSAHDIFAMGWFTNPWLGSMYYIETRNNYRLPPSHRLNIGVNFHKKTKNGMRTWNISIYNMYNAMNPTFVHRSFKIKESSTPESVEYEPVIKKLTLIPLFPSVTYTYKF